MIPPNHPNNTGTKPLLIGLEAQVRAQAEYVFRGNYGLAAVDEIIEAGTSESEARDMTRPCMSSIIVFQRKIYLIDAGPNVLESLRYLGIGVNEIEGIFHTHSHDDHFNGLTALIRSDHRIKYYSAPIVRHCVMKKLARVISFVRNQLLGLRFLSLEPGSFRIPGCILCRANLFPAFQ